MVKEISIKTTTTANKYFKSDIEKNNFNSNSDLYDFIYNSVNSLLTIEKQTISARSNNFLSLLLSHILNNLENRISEKNTTLKADKDSNKNKFENEISEKVSKIIYEKINKKESSEKIESAENKFIISSENISKEILEIFNSDEFKDEITTCINDNVEKHSKETLDIFKNNFENSVLENTNKFKEEISKKLSEEEQHIKNIEKFISTTSKIFQKKSNIVFNKNQIYGFEKNNSENSNNRLSKSNEIISTLENAKDNVKNQIDLTNKKLKKSDIVSNTSDINQVSKKNLNKKFKTNSKFFLGFLPNLSKKVKEKNSNVNNNEKYLKKSFLGKSLHIPFKNFNKKNKKFFKDQEKKKTSFIGNLFTSIVKNKAFIFWSTVFITLLFRKAISAYDYVKTNFSNKESAKDWFHRQKEKILQISLIKDIFDGFRKFKTKFDEHSAVKLLKWFIRNWGWLQYALLAGSILKTALDCGLGEILKNLFKRTKIWRSASRFFTHLRWQIKDALRKGWNKFYTRIFQPFINKVGKFFKNIWGNVSNVLKKFKLSNIRAAISGAINRAWGHINGVFSGIRNKFTQLSISGIKDSIISWFKTQKDNFIKNSQKIFKEVVDKLKLRPIIEKLTKIKELLKSFAQALKRPLRFIGELFKNGFKGIKKITSRIYKFAKEGIKAAAKSFAEKKLAKEFSEEIVKKYGKNVSKETLEESVEQFLKKSGREFSEEAQKKFIRQANKSLLKAGIKVAGKNVLTTAGAILGANLPMFAMGPLDSILLGYEMVKQTEDFGYFQHDDLINSKLNNYKNFDTDLQSIRDVILDENFLKKITYGRGQHTSSEPQFLKISNLYNLTSADKKRLIDRRKGSNYSDEKLKAAQFALSRIINFDDIIFKDDDKNELYNLFKELKKTFRTQFISKNTKFTNKENLNILHNNLKIIAILNSLLENTYKKLFPDIFESFLGDYKNDIIDRYTTLLDEKLFKKEITVKYSDVFNLLDVVSYKINENIKDHLIKINFGEIIRDSNINASSYIPFNPIDGKLGNNSLHYINLQGANYFRHIFPTFKAYTKSSWGDSNGNVDDVVNVFERGKDNKLVNDVLLMNMFLKHTGTFFNIGNSYTHEFPLGPKAASHINGAYIDSYDLNLVMPKGNLIKHIKIYLPDIENIDLSNDNSIDELIKDIQTTYNITDNNLNDESFMKFFIALLTKFMEAAKTMN